MTNLKRILVATDFSQLGNDAVRRATLLAAREDAELLIVHAFPRLSALDTVFSADNDIPRRAGRKAEDWRARQHLGCTAALLAHHV